MYNLTDELLDYEPLQGEVIALQESDFVEADRMSQRLLQTSSGNHRSWAIYQHYLALQAVKQWLNDRSTPVQIDDREAFILLPEHPEGQTVLCQVKISSNSRPFQVCLVVADGSFDEWQLPRVVAQRANLAAHFYVVLTIHEESEQAEILGFIRQDQISEQTLDGDLHHFAIDNLNSDLDQLLLYLTCLEPSAIVLPTTTRSSLNLQQLFIQPILKTQQWINQQLDDLTEAADSIAWQLLPRWEVAPATRGLREMTIGSPMDQLSEILTSLIRNGLQLPIYHRPAYRDLNLELNAQTVPLRLYAITASQDIEQEWSLIVILAKQDGQDLPAGLQLQIQDETTVLFNSETGSDRVDYLYAKVTGELNESFVVTLKSPIETLTLPPFAFQ